MASSSSDKFSASGPESEAEDGLHASASSSAGLNKAPVQLASQAARHQANLNQVRSNDPNDFASKLAHITLEYGPRSQSPSISIPTTVSSPLSTASSMALTGGSRTTVPSTYSGSSRYSSNAVPSLCGTLATLKTVSEASASRVDSGIGRVYHLQTEEGEEEEPPEASVPVRLECCFKFLDCGEVFRDLETWDRHCRAHFRRHLPAEAVCPFQGCNWRRPEERGQDVWQRRLRHMQQEHGNVGYAGGRPDRALLDHMRRSDIISPAEYQELRRDGQLSGQAVLNTASSRRDGRHRRR